MIPRRQRGADAARTSPAHPVTRAVARNRCSGRTRALVNEGCAPAAPRCGRAPEQNAVVPCGQAPQIFLTPSRLVVLRPLEHLCARCCQKFRARCVAVRVRALWARAGAILGPNGPRFVDRKYTSICGAMVLCSLRMLNVCTSQPIAFKVLVRRLCLSRHAARQ